MTSVYDLESPRRVCSKSGLELTPGTRYVGLLREDGSRFVRQDVSLDQWSGETPAGTLAHWRGVVPDKGKKPKPSSNDAALFDCFDRLAGATEPEKLKFDDARRTANGDVLQVRDGRTGKRVEVVDPHLSADDMDAIQAEVFRVLGWD
jgi:hypothetical protein